MRDSAIEPVGIVGLGAFGTALANVVATRGGRALLQGDDAATVAGVNEKRRNERRLPGVQLARGVRATTSIAELARETRLVVLAVPSTRAADVARLLGDVLDGRHLVVHAVGAFAGDRRLSEVIRAETCVKRIGALAGPALAPDLAEKRPSAMVVASPFDEVVAVARAALGAPPTLRVYGTRDLAGVELASAFSGALTVALGLADGLGVGAGPRAVLVTRAVAESARLGAAAGADEKTFHGLAGLGNLLVRSSSASSERSADYQAGLALARGEARRDTEGLRASRSAFLLARRLGVRVPIFEALHAVTWEGIPVDRAAARIVESAAAEE